ncbi:MAG: hypothetical protein Q8R12_00245 [bacterium]|nr:hypothetical protein [bacterium]
MNKIIWFIVIVLVIAGGAYIFRGTFTEKKDEMQATSTPEEAFAEVEGEEGRVAN